MVSGTEYRVGFPQRLRPGESTHDKYIWFPKGPQTEPEMGNVKIPERSFKDHMLLSREMSWIKKCLRKSVLALLQDTEISGSRETSTEAAAEVWQMMEMYWNPNTEN